VVTIGRADGEAPYLLHRIQDVELLSDGHVVVADEGSQKVRVFDSSGVFVREMGGRGQGPGEFTYLWTLEARLDTIAAYDPDERRLTRFLLSGELLSTQRFESGDARPELYIGRYSTGDHVLGWIRRPPTPPDHTVVTPDIMEVGRFGADGRFEEVLGSWPGMRRLGSPVPFSGHFLPVLIGDTLFLTDGMNGAIHAIEPETTARTFHVDAPVLSSAAALARLEGAILDTARLTQTRTILETPGTDSVPSFSEMFVDDQARVWLKTYDPATDSHHLMRPRTGGEWLAVDSSGRVLARLRVPDGFRPMGIRGERAYGVSRDELGVERVLVYALVRE
jgi:hypothetical protein